MKKNQYIFSSEKLQNVPEEFLFERFGNYFLYRDSNLKAFSSIERKTEILLLGFIINPFKPTLTNHEIVKNLAKNESKENLFKELENYSGRYVVFYKDGKELIAMHDMFGQRQINYLVSNEKFTISSSVKLLIEVTNKKMELIPEHTKLMIDKGFQKFDQWFLGDMTWDRNVKKLLPNHYIDLKRLSVERLPFFPVDKMNEKEVIEYTTEVVHGNYRSLIYRYDKIFQALTAGYDSRTLLALSKDYWNKIQFYTFSRGDTNSLRDARIAKMLSNQFTFDYKIIKKPSKDSKFEEWYKNQFIISRTTPKFYNIQYFERFGRFNTINLTGDGVQMVRNLRSPQQLESAEILFDSLGYTHHHFHIENFRKWLESAKKYISESEILISDLFTQEIAQGQLTARWSHEFDLSDCEEFNPFNQKKMIYSIIKNIPYNQRIASDYFFQKKLMENSIKGITQTSFNPPTWKDRLKKLIGKY